MPAHLRVGGPVPGSKVLTLSPFSFNLLGVREPSALEYVNLRQQSQSLLRASTFASCSVLTSYWQGQEL